ncbi:MAG: hypothetical protein P8106_12190, partial [Gammaproteobacteria bacterium]
MNRLMSFPAAAALAATTTMATTLSFAFATVSAAASLAAGPHHDQPVHVHRRLVVAVEVAALCFTVYR